MNGIKMVNKKELEISSMGAGLTVKAREKEADGEKLSQYPQNNSGGLHRRLSLKREIRTKKLKVKNSYALNKCYTVF